MAAIFKKEKKKKAFTYSKLQKTDVLGFQLFTYKMIIHKECQNLFIMWLILYVALCVISTPSRS